MIGNRWLERRRFWVETPGDLRQAERASRLIWLVSISYSVGAVLACAAAVATYVRERRFLSEAVEGRAVVVRIAPAGERSDDVSYVLTDAVGGRQRSSALFGRGKYGLGSEIKVLYVPGRTEAEMQVAGFWREWGIPLLCGFVTAAFAWFAVMTRMLWSRRRQLIERFKAGVYGEVPFVLGGEGG